MANAEPKPRLIYAAIGGLVARYIRYVGSSSRQTDQMTERFDEHAHNHPCIITMWHGQFLLLPLVKQPGYEVDIMLARHRDAELMGAVLRNFGMRLIRGAGAGGRRKDRGGVHAFRAAVQALREGRSVGMTADVPGSGEARRAGLGVVMIARASGKPVMPLAIATSRYMAFNTWSRMTLNLPWSDLGFAVGDVVHVPRDAHGDELEQYRLAVEQSLNAATLAAYARAGVSPRRPGSPHRPARVSRPTAPSPRRRARSPRSCSGYAGARARRIPRDCRNGSAGPARRVPPARWCGYTRRASARPSPSCR
jgi:3-deoxy-D-manno-octulosonic-acid transferase